MNPLPCVIFAFNRTKNLSQVLASIRKQGIDKLIVFVDGPRNRADLAGVEACRDIARRIDWVEVELHLWEENRGLCGLLDNISLVFEKYSWAAFVEDDCLPMPGFYSFIRQALERYQSSKQVFSVGGYQPIESDFFRDYSYDVISCARFMCWGWGTWKDRWSRIYPYQAKFESLFENLRCIPEIGGIDLPMIAQYMAGGKIEESWDIKVAIACLWLNMVHLLPTRGLIYNTGIGKSGVHSSLLSLLRGKAFHNRNVSRSLPVEDLRWLDDTSINQVYMQNLQKWIIRMQRYSPRWGVSSRLVKAILSETRKFLD